MTQILKLYNFNPLNIEFGLQIKRLKTPKYVKYTSFSILFIDKKTKYISRKFIQVSFDAKLSPLLKLINISLLNTVFYPIEFETINAVLKTKVCIVICVFHTYY